jgi:DNA-binding transcriptional LysR family regulator
MNPVDALHTFVRVAELASFTQAAEQLGLPKANVSLAVQRWRRAGHAAAACCTRRCS